MKSANAVLAHFVESRIAEGINSKIQRVKR